jgi:prepilin-type N-terminal cleavage/methylation domain-containing protein
MVNLHPPLSLTPQQRLAHVRGFTLLELLVVLALIAAIVGMAMPNFSRMLDSFSRNTAWRAVESELSDLPFRAFTAGRALRLHNDTARQYLTTLPADWKFAAERPVVYRDSGWCEGGRIVITTEDGEVRTYTLAAPKCEVQ